MPKFVRVLLLTLFASSPLASPSAAWAATSLPQPAWQDWSPQVFAQARAENKLVLLDMAAVWCHWCHVMDEKTYADPAVLAELKQHYRVIRVDQDARPDLSNRYKDYGWPATILFDAQGRELVKRAGYIERREFLSLLQATYKRPEPEIEAQIPKHQISSSAQLAPALRSTLMRKHRESNDSSLGGLRIAMKFLDRDTVEYSLAQAATGDAGQRAAAMQTLDAALNLKDPVWGGFYQYSTHGDWQHPHFEKLLAVQAGYLRIYAQAYAQLDKPQYAEAARSTQRYLRDFLSSPEGAIYASQDADLVPGQHSEAYFAGTDAERRRQGIPRVDKHLYAREAGLAAEALAIWAGISGDAEAAAMAHKAVNWAMANRRIGNSGGFRHAARDVAGPYLADNVAMARAQLALYKLEGRREWLQAAIATTDFINAQFRQRGGGFRSARPQGVIAPPLAVVEENIALVRHANLLSHYAGLPRFRAMAEHGMRYLATPSVSAGVITEAGILLAADELATDPLHLTIVSAKRDAAGEALWRTALRQPGGYQRVEYWDKSQGALLDAKVSYPALAKSAAFVCTANRCSLPAFTPVRLQQMIHELTASSPR
ncbi:MAG: DUF255 domain-containing protein [Pseudomonadota bacterium]